MAIINNEYFPCYINFQIALCGTLDDLTQRLPLKYLPRDYGGENGWLDEEINTVERKFDEYREYFKENANYGADESLRPGKPFDIEGMFGMGGSFRKLEVD